MDHGFAVQACFGEFCAEKLVNNQVLSAANIAWNSTRVGSGCKNRCFKMVNVCHVSLNSLSTERSVVQERHYSDLSKGFKRFDC